MLLRRRRENWFDSKRAAREMIRATGVGEQLDLFAEIDTAARTNDASAAPPQSVSQSAPQSVRPSEGTPDTREPANAGGFSTYWYWSAAEHNSNNAWNLNFSNGSWSNNNKNNNNGVRCVRSRMPLVATFEPPTIDEIYEAYLECRRRKRNTSEAADFETNLFYNLGSLYDELSMCTWEPMRPNVFAVLKPKPREIWASQFRDRVVHHWVYQRLRPVWEPVFYSGSYACIPDRGVHAAVRDAAQAARRVTQQWTREGWWLKCDAANFFGSLHLPTLWRLLEPTLGAPELVAATHMVLFGQRRADAVVRSTPHRMRCIEPHKSLFQADADRGLPIGNLSSQFFANIYMHFVDALAEALVGRGRVFRYVDDILLLGRDLDELRSVCTQIEVAMQCLNLSLNPSKTHFGRLHQGFDFTGFFVLPGRVRVRQSTWERCTRESRRDAQDLQAARERGDARDLQAARQRLASRAGVLKAARALGGPCLARA